MTVHRGIERFASISMELSLAIVLARGGEPACHNSRRDLARQPTRPLERLAEPAMVRAAGRRIQVADNQWLSGPVRSTAIIRAASSSSIMRSVAGRIAGVVSVTLARRKFGVEGSRPRKCHPQAPLASSDLLELSLPGASPVPPSLPPPPTARQPDNSRDSARLPALCSMRKAPN